MQKDMGKLLPAKGGLIMTTRALLVLLVSTLGFGLIGCRGELDRYPKATDSEFQSMKVRYNQLLEEAKKLKPQDGVRLVALFSAATLSHFSVEDFKAKAGEFIQAVAAGQFDKVTIHEARALKRIRVLVVTTAAGKGAIPFTQTGGGWKFDDVGSAFGNFRTKFDDHGTVPAFPPSSTASLAVVLDTHGDSKERLKAALRLGSPKNKDWIGPLAAREEDSLIRAALLYAAWKAGASCESFALKLPLEKEVQKRLYDTDVDSFNALIGGLIECAKSSSNDGVLFAVYQGCFQSDEAPRSIYVEPLLELAKAKPQAMFQAAMKASYPYEQDPVANILVGAFHGEKSNPFFIYLSQQAKKKKTKPGKLAKFWLTKMAERDQIEPPE